MVLQDPFSNNFHFPWWILRMEPANPGRCARAKYMYNIETIRAKIKAFTEIQ